MIQSNSCLQFPSISIRQHYRMALSSLRRGPFYCGRPSKGRSHNDDQLYHTPINKLCRARQWISSKPLCTISSHHHHRCRRLWSGAAGAGAGWSSQIDFSLSLPIAKYNNYNHQWPHRSITLAPLYEHVPLMENHYGLWLEHAKNVWSIKFQPNQTKIQDGSWFLAGQPELVSAWTNCKWPQAKAHDGLRPTIDGNSHWFWGLGAAEIVAHSNSGVDPYLVPFLLLIKFSHIAGIFAHIESVAPWFREPQNVR